MHFEKLSIAGFGPYAGLQEIDFAALAKKGIFSVTGVTGAGKTTIFDALTYALYGDLPGARETRHVRSDHVAAADPTRVELEFSAGNDRWKVARSPEYERPKLRSTGFTKRPAQATLHRWVEGQWEPHSSRNSDVTARCRELVGLDRGQFERVGLLPQGEFRRLLHAPSRERKALFRTLFGTDQINAAVAALKDLATAKAADVRIAEAGTSSLLEQVDQSHAELKGILASHSHGQLALLSPAVGDAAIGDPLPAVVNAAAEVELVVVPLLILDEEENGNRASAAAAAMQTATDQVEQIERRDGLKAALITLNDARPPAEEAAAAAERAVRAAPVAAAHRQSSADAKELLDADSGLADAVRKATQQFADAKLVFDAKVPHQDHLSLCDGQIHTLDALAGTTRDRQQLRKQIDAETGEYNTLEARNHQQDLDHQALTARLEDLEAIEQSAGALAGTTAQLRAEESSLRMLHTAAQRRDTAEVALASITAQLAELETAGTENAATIEHLQNRMEDLSRIAGQLAIRTTTRLGAQAIHDAATERDRIECQLADVLEHLDTARVELGQRSAAFAAGIAPRLASQLLPEEPCMVCGSAVHPDPATEQDGLPAVTEDSVRDASSAHESALAAVSAMQSKYEGLIDTASSHTVDNAATTLLRAEADMQEAIAAAQELKIVTSQHRSALVVERERVAQAVLVAGERTANQSALASALEILSGEEHASSTDLHEQLQELAGRLAAAREAAERHSLLKSNLAEARASLARLESLRVVTTKELATQAGLLGGLEASLAALDEKLAAAGVEDPVKLLALTKMAKDQAAAFIKAANRRGLASQQAQRSDLQFRHALSESGFPTGQEALAAERPPEECEHLAALYAAFQEELQQCEADLAALAKLNLPSALPDLYLLQEKQQAASRSSQQAVEYRVKVQAAIANAQSVVQRLTSDLRVAEELRAEADRCERIAQLCDAKGASKISLEGYVLRSYLDQVLTQANLRLGSLSAGRYQLLLADSAKDARGEWGLDLKISDAHTGESREVTSLSGGETFYTSLALALGLSDVLSNNGATAVSSVFIDEGFGSLDEDVIDLTVDVLSELGNDGVTVGVITHVDAVRHALPAGLNVERLPNGASRVVQYD